MPPADPLVTLVARVVARLEAGSGSPLRQLAVDLDMSFSTCQRLHEEARRRGWLDEAGVPTEAGLVACGRC